MSKIQEALDKIKADRMHGEGQASGDVVKMGGEALTRSQIFASSIATIGEMKQPFELTGDEKDNARIIHSSMSDRYAFNAIRDLRTTIVQRVSETSPIIMVTSCGYEGGGSFVSLNLAASIAMDETKTALLVDCNLADPEFADLPKTEGEVKLGIRDYLKGGDCSVGDIIYPTGVQRLRVIPAGIQNIPMAECFTGIRLHKLFDEVKQRYSHRYIIVDAPPISSNADARILAEVCDHVILVVPYGQVTEEQVLKSARSIGKGKLLGTVFNNEPRFPRLSWK